ncbi:acyl-CoA N-acyltransferase [Dichotomocladium elegans]|nr:acyl-CoA N-acyltransferase [Dichotomocladium elegans]
MAPSNVVIRDATIEDLKFTDHVVTVINTAYRSEASWTSENDIVDGPRVDRTVVEDLVRKNGQPRTLLYAIEQDAVETVVGTSMIEPTTEGEAEVRLFSVKPSHQSRGLGGLIFRATLERMKELGIKVAVLRVFDSRSDILQWYKKLGFEVTGELKYTDTSPLKLKDANFIILKKTLL